MTDNEAYKQHDKAVAFELMMARPAEGRLVLLRHQDLDLKCRRQVSVFEMEREMRIKHASREIRIFQNRRQDYRKRREELRMEKLLTHSTHGPNCAYYEQLQANGVLHTSDEDVTEDKVGHAKKPRPRTMGAPNATLNGVLITELDERAKTAPDRSTARLPPVASDMTRHRSELQLMKRRVRSFMSSANPGDENYRPDNVRLSQSLQQRISQNRNRDLFAAMKESRQVIDNAWHDVDRKSFDQHNIRTVTQTVRKARYAEDRARRLNFEPVLVVQRAAKRFLKSIKDLNPDTLD